jgi:hypothetical protein
MFKADDGETFSLFGSTLTSEGYFRRVAGLADLCQGIVPDRLSLIELLRMLTKSRWRLRHLAKSREHYHLAMGEIELVNRENERSFHEAGKKIAFLPHCLRDRSRACR